MKIATIQSIDDTQDVPIATVTYLGRTETVALANEWGVNSNPPAGTPCYLMNINGDAANRIACPLSMSDRKKELAPGDYSVGSWVGKSDTTYKADGSVEITVPGVYNLTAESFSFNGNVEVTGDVDITGTTSTVGDLDVTGSVSSTIDIDTPLYKVGGAPGVSGVFISADGPPKTVTVQNGIIISIV